MKETEGTVVKGVIQLPPAVQLPEGATVKIHWEDAQDPKPLELEPLAVEDVEADILWATGKKFGP
jgi:hypothetical protein